jgi:hypothetical protein
LTAAALAFETGRGPPFFDVGFDLLIGVLLNSDAEGRQYSIAFSALVIRRAHVNLQVTQPPVAPAGLDCGRPSAKRMGEGSREERGQVRSLTRSREGAKDTDTDTDHS